MRKIFAIAIVTLLGSTAFAAGEVYRWKDASGVWHYSDQPQPGAELMRGARVPVPVPAATPVPTPVSSSPIATSETLPVSPEVAQQVRKEAADAKSEQCEKAKAAYDRSVQARRMFRTDADGKQTFFTEAEMDAARLQARSNRDLACGA
jgi:type IV secretory pathway VirB10-like protein